jgi:hypothetical protein
VNRPHYTPAPPGWARLCDLLAEETPLITDEIKRRVNAGTLTVRWFNDERRVPDCEMQELRDDVLAEDAARRLEAPQYTPTQRQVLKAATFAHLYGGKPDRVADMLLPHTELDFTDIERRIVAAVTKGNKP